MKKTLIGCLVVMVIMGIGGAIGAYYFLWRPAKATFVEFTKLQEIPKLNQQVRKTTPFTPPSDNVLTSDAVERFVQTQQTIQTTLGKRVDELDIKYREILHGRPDYKPSWSELTSAYKDLAGIIVDAKRVQVEALNTHNFSLAEYEWTRQRVYEAAGLPINVDFEKFLRGIAEGKIPAGEKQTSTSTEAPATPPERNRALVAPHVKGLGERAGLAAFGL